jgi:hypothetical protein
LLFRFSLFFFAFLFLFCIFQTTPALFRARTHRGDLWAGRGVRSKVEMEVYMSRSQQITIIILIIIWLHSNFQARQHPLSVVLRRSGPYERGPRRCKKKKNTHNRSRHN